jgi:hypothetical protein
MVSAISIWYTDFVLNESYTKLVQYMVICSIHSLAACLFYLSR